MKHILLPAAFVFCAWTINAQIGSKPDLSIFPNPTTEYISVKDNNDVVGHIAVFNLVGKKVKDFEFVKGDQYSVSDLPKGMYLVQIQDRNRKTLMTQKVDKR